MQVHDYDPRRGQAFQGDVAIIPIPAGITIATTDEIKPIDGRLIIQEGEMTGHHHAIRLPASQSRRFRQETRELGDPSVSTGNAKLRKLFGKPVGTAHLYRDREVANEMVRRGLLTRADLAVACLVVKDGPVTISHEEHDGIRVPVGNYLIGRQVESAGAEERVVSD